MNKLKSLMIGLIIVSTVLTIGWTSFAIAAEFVVPNERTDLTISKEQTARNLFAAGETVNIEAKEIHKDLFVAGRTITVDTAIENNVFAAGETVNIKGRIGGNLFAFSKTLIISAEIEGDIFAFGAEIFLEDGAHVHGDIFSGSGTLHLKGRIIGDVSATCEDAIIDGSVLGTLQLKVDRSLTISSTALIQELVYSSPKVANIEEGSEIRMTTYTPMVLTDKSGKGRGNFPGIKLMDWISSLILAFLFLVLLKKPCQGMVNKIQEQFGLSVAFGVSFIIGVPIATILLLVSFVGFKVALVLAFFAFFVWTIAGTMGSLLLGVFIQYLLSKDKKAWSNYMNWISVVLGVSIFKLLALVPVLGWLAQIFFITLGIGGFLMYVARSSLSKEVTV
jgi:cytoskeletal protein CcmA (bactofilin family)